MSPAPDPATGVVGLVLAAGAGRRMGRPKATCATADGELLLDRAVRVLRAGGCEQVVVTLGAGADFARSSSSALAHPGVRDVDVLDHDRGVSSSLRAGLGAAAEVAGLRAVLITLVDLPDLTPEVLARLLSPSGAADANARTNPALTGALRRATYDGRPGHPVLLGRDHLTPFVAGLRGDEGGRRYLAEAGCTSVPCGDLATGRDVDTPAELARVS